MAEARAARSAGADRLELCRDLDTGGLTPMDRTVTAVVSGGPEPVAVLVRHRPGDFRTSPSEVLSMVRTVERLAERGVEAVVVGALDSAGRIDREALSEITAAAGDVSVAFHRAFDEVSDPLAALDDLRRAGVSRVLTSGCAPTAWEGRHVLRDLVNAGEGAIDILGGGGVRADHVVRLIEATGLRQVHARASAIPALVGAVRSWEDSGLHG